MYIINDTYFQAPKREIPNLDEADSKAFAELERLIDEKCRLFMYYFLTPDEVTEFNSYLVNGLFPIITTGIPQKWIDLVNGKIYQANGVDLVWNGLISEKGTSKQSLMADFVYHSWLESQVSYMTSVGDAKGNPKGAVLVNPTQRIVTGWNDFVKQYQGNYRRYIGSYCDGIISYAENPSNEVSLMQFLSDHPEDYTKSDWYFFEAKNQLGL